jgi:HD-GYP domain-containing protein (c-di-GMP phosphodiesterase class II)
MTTTRSYREAMGPAAAAAELVRCSGTQFDPAVVQALLAVLGVEPAEARDGDLLAA